MCNTNPIPVEKKTESDLIKKSKQNLYNACQHLLNKITEIYNSQIAVLDSLQYPLKKEVIIDDLQISLFIEQVSLIFSINPKEAIRHSQSLQPSETNDLQNFKDSKEVIEVFPGRNNLRRSTTQLSVIENGDRLYEGTFEEEKFLTGYGKVTTAKGDIFMGNTVNGLFEGNGTIVFSSGQRYEGEWREGKRHGFGKNYWPNGNSYEGNFANGIIHGMGKFLYNNGDIYEGNFVSNKRQGEGTYYFRDGDSEQGNWVDSKLEGVVIRTVKGKSRPAEYKDGKFQKYI